jgi:4-hydroxybenzoate polyprenyltransferase
MNWFLSIRPLAVGMSVLITAFAYSLVGMNINIIILIFIFFAVAATMVTNDYVDRHHDATIGKTFALEQGNKFLWYATILWVITAVLVGIITISNWQAGLLALVIATLGLSYKFSYKKLFLPEIIVATEYILVTLFPVIEGGTYDWYIAPLIGLLILTRENVKNIDHAPADVKYKTTIAATYGTQTAAVAARCIIAAAVTMGLLLIVTSRQSASVVNVQIASMVIIALAGNWLLSEHFPRARLVMDLGASLFLISGIHGVIKQPIGTSMLSTDSAQKYGLSTGFPNFQPERVNQPVWVWPAMIGLLFVVVTTIRIVAGTVTTNYVFLSGNITGALVTGISIILIFLFFFLNPWLIQSWNKQEEKETPGYRLVKRMSSGLLLGIICVVLGNNPWLIGSLMVAISIVAIVRYPSICWHLKQRGFQLGAITALSLFGGIIYAIEIFGPAYAVTIGFYYAYRRASAYF